MELDSGAMLAAEVFSDTYDEARRKFLTAVPTSVAYACSAKGPSEEALFTDVAYFGPADAKRLLVLVSGTHGPEGYCGSAAQLLFLKTRLNDKLPRDSAVLCIHALNCYGFAWDRRSTAEGCDLNRNFVDFTKPLPSNLGYEELAEYFIPVEMSTDRIREADDALAAYRSAYGEQKYWQARMAGQYTRPGGLFYGGTKPTEARLTLERIVSDFSVASRERVIIIDYHTGQGRYGYGELMCEPPSGIPGYERAFRIFGPTATSPDLGTSTSVALFGSQDDYWEHVLGDRHTYVALEFGTYANPTILRNEHWLFLYRSDEVNSKLGRDIRKATKDHFYPQRLDWKEMVTWRCHQVHRQAVHAMAITR